MSRSWVILSVVVLAGCRPPSPDAPKGVAHEEKALTEKPPVVPDTPPWDGTGEEYVFQVGVAWNMHHKFGASGLRRYTKVTMVLGEGGPARIVDEGENKESELDNTYGYEGTITAWSSTWNGTWVMEGDELSLELTLAEHTCTQQLEKLDEVNEDQPCEQMSGQMELICRRTPMDVEPPLEELAAGAQSVKMQAWLCNSDGQVDGPGTPLAWVFGLEGCIEASSGPHGKARTYRLCHSP